MAIPWQLIGFFFHDERKWIGGAIVAMLLLAIHVCLVNSRSTSYNNTCMCAVSSAGYTIRSIRKTNIIGCWDDDASDTAGSDGLGERRGTRSTCTA